VLGEWRALPTRNTLVARSAGASHLEALLAADTSGRVARAACDAAERLEVPGVGAILAAAARQAGHEGDTRARALATLERIGASGEAVAVARTVDADAPLPLRRAARDVLARAEPAAAAPILASLARDAGADIAERRGAIETLASLDGQAADDAITALVSALADSEVIPTALRLDVLEAGATRGQQAANQHLATTPFDGCDEGGNQKAGERLFREHPAAQCMRCHSYRGTGGQAGPTLDGIGKSRDRAYLLRALTEPGADIAEGFAQVTVTKTDGSLLAGIIKSESTDELVLIDANSQDVRIPKNEITNRETGGSAMPPMGTILTRREIRDLVEFLSQTK
jgi:quinoprotein glucose dehydrogenase